MRASRAPGILEVNQKPSFLGGWQRRSVRTLVGIRNTARSSGPCLALNRNNRLPLKMDTGLLLFNLVVLRGHKLNLVTIKTRVPRVPFLRAITSRPNHTFRLHCLKRIYRYILGTLAYRVCISKVPPKISTIVSIRCQPYAVVLTERDDLFVLIRL